MFEFKVVVLTSTAIVLGISYYMLRKKCILDAVDAFRYLTIKIVENTVDCDEVIKEILKQCVVSRAIGFDCEWVTVNGNKRPVALIQISTYDGFCGLFRLNKLQHCPESLKELLEDEKIYKVGVAPIDDAKYIAADYGINLKATLDIRHIAQLCGYDPGGLATLSKSLLGIVLDKSWRIRCSDWEVDQLSDRQLNYAAADAHVAIRMFVKLFDQYSRSKWPWWKWSHNEQWSNIDNLCWQYADVCFKTKTSKKMKNGMKEVEKQPKKELAQSKRYPYAARSSPLYHNCFLQAPDGELLCTCDTKKAKWYVEKELADVITEEPLTVRLRFEPAGRSVGEVGKYYQLTKQNVCVVCGEHNSYIRKNVVPREYRKHFPEVMKDHSSHDVVLLCVSCHQRSNMRDQAVRERLAQTCDAPFADHVRAMYIEDVECKKVRSAARALLYQARKHVLPPARRKELENILLQNFPAHDMVTEELLNEAAEMSIFVENADYESHGHKVTEFYLEQGGLLRLEELWREHFLQSMKPQYMPKLWSVTHTEERLRVRLSEGRLSEEDLKLIGTYL
ncbi:unnamed protein product [Leptosia nina]|uniref:3'-5' exonuclease domain-containing protein n=1 Tax=Leptosia nina TaxID=320188 RepID=A0AAV1JH95_9NEOP